MGLALPLPFCWRKCKHGYYFRCYPNPCSICAFFTTSYPGKGTHKPGRVQSSVGLCTPHNSLIWVPNEKNSRRMIKSKPVFAFIMYLFHLQLILLGHSKGLFVLAHSVLLSHKWGYLQGLCHRVLRD
jgi:hypothetical protein